MKLREYEKIKEIYSWASEYTAEGMFRAPRKKGEEPIEDFYQTESFMRIMFKLINLRRALIGILGLQGSGKTRTLYEIQKELLKRREDPKTLNAIYFKWSKDFLKNIAKWDLFWTRYYNLVKSEVLDELEDYGRRHKKHPKLGRIPNENDIYHCEHGDYDPEKFLPKNRLNELTKEAIYIELETTRYILIDMPDYTKSTARSMSADIDSAQELWQRIQAEDPSAEVSFVFAFQKEMVMKHPHFFIGKLDLVTLKPLRPNELIEAYKLRNGTVEPFTEDALNLLGQLSRGIFRRFLKYIQITIEKNLDNEYPVTVEHINNSITEDLIIEDMELELSDIFKEKDKKAEAVRVLNFVRQQGECNIKTIAEGIDLSEKVVQRLIQKLHGYRYVDTKRGKGKEILVSLKL